MQDGRAPSEYQGRKRKEFEERIRRTRGSIKEWLQYANWEAGQNDFARSRSIFERALDVDPRSVQLWLSYTEMELKSRNVQHARNLFDRAVTLLPRVDQLWYKYVFERWMKWEPDDKAWQAYIKLEERYNELDRASAIYERWIGVRPEPRVWVKWGKFEEDRGNLDKAREVFQTALGFYGDEEELVEKAQAFALARIPRSKSASLYASYTKFEKQHGTRNTLESTVLGKRRIQYEEELAHDGRNYDVWFDYTRLEEGAWRDLRDEGSTDEELEAASGRVRDVYERAISQVPPGGEKRHWRRYIFLWLDYALFEEIETKVSTGYNRARQIYETAIKLVPHKQFTFAKLWLMFAKFEIRRIELTKARKIMGAAIGMCPKEALFKGYIDLEVESHTPGLRTNPRHIRTGRFPSPLSMPELLWKAYIDFEFEEGERERARALYERLIALSGHVKVWIAFASFEAEPIPIPRAQREEEEADEGEDEDEEVKTTPGDPSLARQVFERGYKDMKNKGMKSERVALLEVWKTFEENNGTSEDVVKVQGMMPIVSKRRHVDQETGQTVEDWDLVFADDEQESNPTSFKFLQMAHAWKKAQAKGSGAALSGFTASTNLSSAESGRDDANDVASSHGGDSD
ncbi:hypothetical protein BD779DRAFT_1612457 [Infundibulicybe gibba]|nr:hypothetical protein BD779DRAFT_1612457 [Infundibulicybe gibba]